MRKLLSYPFSVLAYTGFILALLIFHPIQVIALRVFGYQAHKRSVDILSFFLNYSLLWTFSYSKIEGTNKIPAHKPLIFVANHQGVFDIAGMSWHLRAFHPKYVSKKELGQHIPSIGYNLRYGGSALIDRNDPKQALPVIKQLGEYIQAHNRSAIIFPEGTRTRNGKPRDFASNGLKILCKYAPDAYVVPITINNSWKVFQYGSFPLGLGVRIRFTVHNPIAVNAMDFNSLFEHTQKTIVGAID